MQSVVCGEVNKGLITFQAINGGVTGVHIYGSNRAIMKIMSVIIGTVYDSNFGNGVVLLQYSMRRTDVRRRADHTVVACSLQVDYYVHTQLCRLVSRHYGGLRVNRRCSRCGRT